MCIRLFQRMLETSKQTKGTEKQTFNKTDRVAHYLLYRLSLTKHRYLRVLFLLLSGKIKFSALIDYLCISLLLIKMKFTI